MPEAIRAAKPPFVVEYHHDPKNKFRFADTTPDDEWLAKVAAEGWIILSHDRKFHTLLPEAAAVKQYGAGCFYLPGASSPTWDKVGYFIKAFDGIERRVRATGKPFIFDINYKLRFRAMKIP